MKRYTIVWDARRPYPRQPLYQRLAMARTYEAARLWQRELERTLDDPPITSFE